MVRDLYGLNSTGAACITMFSETLRDSYFVPTVSYPYFYHRQSRNPNGEDFYEFILVYVDDVLCCSHNHHLIIDVLALTYDLKYG